MIIGEQKPLVVHIVFQDGPPAPQIPARDLASQIYARLARGPRPSGIPVNIWKGVPGPAGSLAVPRLPTVEDAARNVVIVLIDRAFFESRRVWQGYLDALGEQLRPRRDLLLPVSICGDAHRVANALADINCVPVKDPQDVAGDELVFQAIFTAILRLLPDVPPPNPAFSDVSGEAAALPAPPRVFLCHAKSDGNHLARELRRYIYEQTQLTCFFDSHDIPHGLSVRESIRRSIAESCLLVVWTDAFLESRWCQAEVAEARQLRRPVLVLDALQVQSPRVAPNFVNMPVVRWRNDPGKVLSALLLELVRTRHTWTLFESLRSRGAPATAFCAHPPDKGEASDFLGPRAVGAAPAMSAAELVVYPDPPLHAEEMVALHGAFPNLHLRSLSEWMALWAADALPKEGRAPGNGAQSVLSPLSIGLSVSEAETWSDLGLIAEHQEDFLVSMARQLILLGGRLLWGGDLRRNGIGERLEALVRAYHHADRAPQDHIANYLAWPIHRRIPAAELQERRAIADVVCLPRPALDAEDDAALDALCYSALRRRMAGDSHARIILGGKLRGYAGRYPGVAEEALETIKRGVPLYVIGGFGGAARAVFDAIAQPEPRNALRTAWDERCKDRSIREVHARYDLLAARMDDGLRDLSVDHDGVLTCFAELGVAGLSARNKLTLAENKRLALCQDIHEITALLVKGLAGLAEDMCQAT
ncbi:TIR domain-containing protein [Azospirillum argentinense]